MRPRAIAIVTVGAALSCNPSATTPVPPPPPETSSHNPPAPLTEGAPIGEAPAAAKPPADPASYQALVNPYSDKDGVIFHAKIGCIVFPSDGTIRPPGGMPPSKDIDCPPIMRDSVWAECVGGTVMSNEAGTACVCEVGGNPPTPAVAMSRCPTHG